MSFLLLIGKHVKKPIDENIEIVRVIVTIRNTLRSILSDPILELLKNSHNGEQSFGTLN